MSKIKKGKRYFHIFYRYQDDGNVVSFGHMHMSQKRYEVLDLCDIEADILLDDDEVIMVTGYNEITREEFNRG